MSNNGSAVDTNFTIDDIYASVDTEWLVSSFDEASTAYTCSGLSNTLVSANYCVNPILIPRNAHTAPKINTPTVSNIYEPTVDAATDTEIESKLEVNHATVSNIYERSADRRRRQGHRDRAQDRRALRAAPGDGDQDRGQARG